MFNAILSIILLVKECVKFGLVLSYKTGQLLVNLLGFLLNGLIELFTWGGILFKIVLEDFIDFLNDVNNRLQWLFNIFNIFYINILSFLNGIIQFISSIYLLIENLTSKICLGLISVTGNVGLLIANIIIGLKELIILVGSGIWFTITFIPFSIVGFCHTLIEFIQECVIELNEVVSLSKQSIIKFYHFLIDVPLESIAGIIIGCSIMYIIVQLHLEFGKFLWELLIPLVRFMKRQWRNLKHFIVQEIVGFFQKPTMENYDMERQCVVCNERSKSILVLPCRHLCLCMECNTRLKNYNQTCPICRTEIEDTMKVFL